MSTKRWRMSVVTLGKDEVLHDVRVDAENWMSALRLARAKTGESGGVPPGSSCAVAPDGKVTILDPIQRRRFVLETGPAADAPPPAPALQPAETTPASQPAAEQPEPASAPAGASPVSPMAAASPPREGAAPAAPAKKKKNLKQTMAYIPNEPIAPPAEAKKKKRARKTMAYLPPTPEAVRESSRPPADAGAAPAAAQAAAEQAVQQAAAEEAAQQAAAEQAAAEQAAAEQAAAEQAAQQAAAEQAAAEQAAQQAAAEQAAEDAAANANADPSFKVLHSRDEDPSASSPLTYRERSYALPPGTPLDEAERFIRNQADALMAELDHVAKGRFLNLAAFDHEWSGKPTRKPLVTLALKDWQGDAVVERHQPSVPPPRARRSNTDEHDRRLADAFEACQDLLFLATPLEAVDFAQKLLSDLIPCEATAGALYDIDDSVHRIVSATGPGAEERKGASVPHDAGIFGAVTASRSTVVFPSDDTRYAAEHDGRPGLQVRDGLYAACMHDGRFFGVLQLLNSTNGTFDQSDADLARYVAGQLGEFLARARASMRAQR